MIMIMIMIIIVIVTGRTLENMAVVGVGVMKEKKEKKEKKEETLANRIRLFVCLFVCLFVLKRNRRS
jgi:hypothetical protein